MTSPALGTVARAPEVQNVQLAEHLANRSRAARVATRGGAAASWMRAAFALDTAMLLAAIAATELGATAAGVEHVPVVWLAVFPLLLLGGPFCRSLYDLPHRPPA